MGGCDDVGIQFFNRDITSFGPECNLEEGSFPNLSPSAIASTQRIMAIQSHLPCFVTIAAIIFGVPALSTST